MPQIPDLSETKRPTPQPSGGVARYRGEEPSLEAPGQSLMHAGRILGHEANQLYAEVQHQQERADHLRAEQAFSDLRNQQMDLTVGEQNGYERLKGSAVTTRPVLQDWGKKFDDQTDLIANSLATDGQREKFRARASVARLQFNEGLARHIVKESDRYADEVFAGTISTEVRAAGSQWNDPMNVGLSLERINAAVRDQAELKKWPAVYAEAERLKAETPVHAAVIGQALASGNYLYAQAWYNEHKNDIDKNTAAQLAKAVEGATQKQASAGYRAEYLANQNDPGVLKALNDRVLKDGVLDEDRRNNLNAMIQGRISTLENKAQLQYERAMRLIERGVNELNSNTLAGFPPNADQFTPYLDMAKGTEMEPLVRAALGLAKSTDVFRSLQLTEQERIVNQAEAGIRADPTKFDRKTVAAWRTILNTQRQEAQNAPVSFAVRQGLVDPLAQLDLDNPQQSAVALEQRFNIGRGMVQRYQAPFKPLMPEEVINLKSKLAQTPVAGRRQYFSNLAQAAGTDYEGYSAVMAQLAEDDPATAIAGQYAYRGRNVAADAILAGQAMLHPVRKEDGHPDKGKIWPMPPDKDLRAGFNSYERDAYAGHPGARNGVYQAALAIYAKKSSDEGDASAVINSSRWDESIKLATGGIEKYRGKAIVLPYGYEYGQFRDGLNARIDTIVEGGQLAKDLTKGRLQDMPLEAIGDGRYMFKAGDGILVDKDQRPVIVDFNVGLPFKTSGVGIHDLSAPPSAAELELASQPARRTLPGKKGGGG